jgi:HEAT repeat protein
MLRKKDSPSVLRLIDFWDRHIVRFRYLPASIQYPVWYLNQAHRVNASALSGFEILGADAQQAVPALIKIYEQHNSPLLPDYASLALIAIGPEAAIPLFVRDTGSSNLIVREGAVMALWNVYTEPRLIVPALAKLLSDTNINVRYAAARGIQHFGTNAQQAAPALVPMLSDPDTRIRRAAAIALKAIDPEAAAKAGVK